METQISVEKEIDIEEEGKIGNANLLQDEKNKRQNHVDVLLIGIIFATFLSSIIQIYSHTEKAMMKYPRDNHSGHFHDMFISEDKYFIMPIEYWIIILNDVGYQFLGPLVYFLSGWNVFYSLFKRSEREFREERVHRLLVPILIMSLLQIFDAFSYFAPLDVVCQQWFDGEDEELFYNETKKCNLFYPVVDYHPPFISVLVQNSHYGVPLDIVLLFIYSQSFAFWFSVYHPNQNKQGVPTVPYCGTTTCCCSRKPPYSIARCFCCLHFFCKPAASPVEFVSAVTWYIGGPVRIILLPGLALFIAEAILDLPFHVTSGLHMSHIFSKMVMYLLGYAMASTASTGIQDITKKYRKLYLAIGLSFILAHTVANLFIHELDHQGVLDNKNLQPLLYFLGTFGSWPFVVGLVSVAKETFTDESRMVSFVREAAMAFYINHHWVVTLYLAGAFWVPYLRSFPFTVIFGSLITGCVSLLITKAKPLRYFFGLRCPPGSSLPGTRMRGMIPVTVLAVTYTIYHCVISFHKDTVVSFEDN